MLRIWLSDWRVSSNPGVSIRVTVRPPKENGFEVWTDWVTEHKPSPVGREDPLTRLMNYKNSR